MKANFNSVLVSLFSSMLLFTACSPKKSSDDGEPTYMRTVLKAEDETRDIAKQLKTELKALKQFPTLTVIMVPKSDLQQSINNLLKQGGKVLYDPNNGAGSTIPFYIAELTPKQIGDVELIKSLELKAASIEEANKNIKPFEREIPLASDNYTANIPTDSVQIEALGDKTTLGAGVTVAVIDTGIDASHPAFGGRVVYWYDGTQETRTKLSKVEIENNAILIEGEKVILPEDLIEGETFAAVLWEKNLFTQLGDGQRVTKPYLDLNQNQSSDKYLVVVVKSGDKNHIYFDVDGDMKLTGFTELKSRVDYNTTKKSNRNLGMVEFPTRNNVIQYPILLEEEGDDIYINLGKTNGSHGTHVAGIIAADDQSNNLLGAAPKANLMSLKVCSGISCTESAIIKGLYKAFYNGKVIPDVVNISLGSHEGFKKDVFSYLFNDLSAKFGTVFFISASNSGPGFRSLNHFGNSGAVVMVGANVSKQTLRDQYNLSGTEDTFAENLLFFSSLGPSYTSEMKPNIIAPGGAIAPVPYASTYLTQMNGTSMSSPLAAGAMAAILGELKKEDKSLFSKIAKARKYHLNGSTQAKESMLPYVYAMRDALQNTADEQKHLTTVQQGYGLIQAGKAKAELQKYMAQLTEGSRTYFEVVLNDYKQSYDRSGESPKEISSFKLSIGADGERTKSDWASIAEKGVNVVLHKVEILNSLGDVDKITKKSQIKKYFSIVDRGNDNNKLLETKIAFINRRNSTLLSKRYLENMMTGKTYIAHYIVKFQGVTVQNILDVVHMPYELKKRAISVKSIDSSKTKTVAGFAVESRVIKTNTFHRYPILVTDKMNSISVKAAISDNKDGMLYVQIYSPRGKEMGLELARNSSVYPFTIADIKVPTMKDGKQITGVWEVTVSSASSNWLSKTSYDLLVEGSTFGAKQASYTLARPDELTIPVVGNVSRAEARKLQQIYRQKMSVKTGYISYQKLMLPRKYTGSVEIKANSMNKEYSGRLDHRLYIKKGDEFIPYKSSVRLVGETFIISEEILEEVFFAFETFGSFGEGDFISATKSKTVEVITAFELNKKIDLKTKIEKFIDTNISLLKITASFNDIYPISNEAVELKVEMSVFSGTKSYTTVSGEEVASRDEKTIKSSFDLYIK